MIGVDTVSYSAGNGKDIRLV